MITLDQAIDTIQQLPAEQQEMLFDIVYRRRMESRREEIARDARRSIADFYTGRLKPQSIGEILSELRAALDDMVEP